MNCCNKFVKSGVGVSKEIAELLVPNLHQVVCPVHIEVCALVGVPGDRRKFFRPVLEVVVSPWIQVV